MTNRAATATKSTATDRDVVDELDIHGDVSDEVVEEEKRDPEESLVELEAERRRLSQRIGQAKQAVERDTAELGELDEQIRQAEQAVEDARTDDATLLRQKRYCLGYYDAEEDEKEKIDRTAGIIGLDETFAAIDFEFDPTNDWAYEVGVAVFVNGKIEPEASYSTLIRPIKKFEDGFEKWVEKRKQRLGSVDIQGLPEFHEAWDRVSERLRRYEILDKHIVVAHNAPSDMSVLEQTVDSSNLKPISAFAWIPLLRKIRRHSGDYSPGSFHCACTYQVAKSMIPGLSDYRLETVCDELGIELDHPHDPLEDATATGQLWLKLAEHAKGAKKNHAALLSQRGYHLGYFDSQDDKSRSFSKLKWGYDKVVEEEKRDLEKPLEELESKRRDLSQRIDQAEQAVELDTAELEEVEVKLKEMRGLTSRAATRERYSFGNLKQILEMPDLIAIQSKSFSKFLNEGLAQAFHDISPITDYSGMLQLELELELEDEDLLPPPKFTVEECKEKDMTYSSPVFARARFLNGHTGEIKEQVVFMGDFPKMTDYGTFIINGTERVVVSQLVRSPGVIFQPGERYRLRNFAKHQLVTGTIHPYRGEWVEFDVEQRPHKEVTAGARVARKRRLPLFTLLRALGYGEERHPNFLRDFVDHFDFLEEQWDKQAHIGPTQTEALIEIYKRVRPGEPATAETARSYFERAFFTPRRYDLSRVGRHKLNRKLKAELEFLNETFGLGLREADPDNPDDKHPELSLPHPEQSHLSPCEMLATASYMLNLAKGEPGYRLDDQDHFANRRIRSVGELIQNQVRIGLTRMERVVRDRMTTQELEAMTPQTLINIRSVVTALKEFFGSSQLSQFMDQTNPLAGLIHRRRISALGPGGLSRERAGFEVRDVHFSHYGRMCPIETPEGPNIGLIGALASFARINDHGFIESPYRIVEDGKATDQVVYLAADDEEEYVIAQANTPIDDQGNFEHERVLARLSPQATSLQDLRLQLERDVFFGATTEITFVSPTEVQMMDISPQQIVSVATALIPFLEHNDANRALMGANMQRQAVPLIRSEAPYVGTGVEGRTAHDAGDVVTAAGRGVVSSLSAGHIEVDYDEWGYVEVPLRKFERSNQDTCVNQKPVVRLGDEVEKGDVLADGPSTDHGELALGKNLMVAFMPWEGYNFEDAIVLSERLVRDDVLTSVHIHEYEIDARDTKLGVEEITRDIPNLSEDILADLDRRGIVRIGAEVEPGDVLVGKVTPKGETELSGEERLLRAIFGDKARDVRDNSLKVPHGEGGKVVDVKVFDRDDNHELPPGVNQLVRVYVAQIRKISVGDKLAGRHGNKGVISRILPMEDMPFTADGTPVDIILNPLGVPSRMNVGQVLEAHLGYCARWGWKIDGEQVGDEPVRGTERKTRSSSPPSCFVATPVFDGAVWDEKNKSPDNPTIVDILTNINPESADGERLIGIDGKQTLYNGRTGEPYDTPITTGYVYVLKLAHLVDDKIHARSTGPYSMIHQQPLGGKAQFGGQRFGEMEVWALEAYGAAYCLQELLTLKSDDVAGRARVYEAIVKGKNVPEPGIPESFRVLIKEMQSLCLNVEVLSSNGMEMQLHELDEDSLSNLADLGISLHRPERGSDKEDKTREAMLVGTSR